LCLYEKREDRLKPNPLNMRRDKPQDGRAKLRPNPLNLRRDKPQDGRAFLGATYTSDDEDDEDEDKVVGMASLALASSDSLFNQDYSKDYGRSSSSFTCLMARAAKVTTSSPL
jgi:hypothetical protein